MTGYVPKKITMRKIILALLLGVLTFSCTDNKGGEVCRIVDMTKLTEKDLASHIAKIFPKKDYIILDDSKGFYPGSIEKSIFRNKKLYIQSRISRTDELLVFAASGEFLFRVGMMGRAANEFLGISGFDVNDKDEILINDIVGQKILKFDNTGNYMQTINLPFEDIYGIKALSNDNFLLCLAQWNTTEPKQELVLFGNNQAAIHAYYRDNVDDNYLLHSPDFTVAGDKTFFLNNLNDTVYCMDREGALTEKIYFDFGSRNVPSEDKVDLEQKIEVENKYRNYAAIIQFCCEDSDYIYGGLFDKMVRKFFVLDKQNSILYTSNQEDPSPFGSVVGFDGKCLISYLDYIAYESAPDAFDDTISQALKNDKIVICLYNTGL